MVIFCLALLISSLPRYSILTQAQSDPLCPGHAIPFRSNSRCGPRFSNQALGGKEARRRNSRSNTTLFRRRDIYRGRIYSLPDAMLHLSFLPVPPFIPRDLPLSQDNNTNTTTPTTLTKPNPKSQVEPIGYRSYVQTRISSPSTTQIQFQIPNLP